MNNVTCFLLRALQAETADYNMQMEEVVTAT